MNDRSPADRARDIRRLVELEELTVDEGIRSLREIFGPDAQITEAGYRSMIVDSEIFEGRER